MRPWQSIRKTALWAALGRFDPARPVFVESESKKVGNLRVPEALIARMREGECLRLEAPPEVRAELLLEDYAHLVGDPPLLREKLGCLAPLHGRETIERWNGLADAGNWRGLVADLLEAHYDPAYRRSMFRNYAGAASASVVPVRRASREGFLALAREIGHRQAGTHERDVGHPPADLRVVFRADGLDRGPGILGRDDDDRGCEYKSAHPGTPTCRTDPDPLRVAAPDAPRCAASPGLAAIHSGRTSP